MPLSKKFTLGHVGAQLVQRVLTSDIQDLDLWEILRTCRLALRRVAKQVLTCNIRSPEAPISTGENRQAKIKWVVTPSTS